MEYDEIKWMINTSIDDGRRSIQKCTSIDVLKQALAKEIFGMNRKTMIKMLAVRIRKLEASNG